MVKAEFTWTFIKRSCLAALIWMSVCWIHAQALPDSVDYMQAFKEFFTESAYPLKLDSTKICAPQYGYTYQCINVKSSDGDDLLTEMWLPDGKGPWPVVITRTPYLKEAPADNNAEAQAYAQRGIGRIIQRCRGTGGSAGEYIPNVNERADGLALVNWVAAQPWCKNIGLTGSSYLAFTCWIIADAVPKKVKGIFLSHYGVDRHLSAYKSGLFRQDILTTWAIQNAGLAQQPTFADNTRPYFEQMRYMPQVEMDTVMLGKTLSWYRDWITHTDYPDLYWHEGYWEQLRQIPKQIRIPMYIIAGHYDHHLEGTLLGYQLLPEETKAKSRLVVGSWNHFFSITPRMGARQHACDIDLGAEAFNWFHGILCDGVTPEPQVSVYAVGKDEWMTFRNWPEMAVKPMTLYLTKDRQISKTAPVNGGTISYTYDPQNPVLTIGGETAFTSYNRSGSILQPAPDYRDDVVTFLSDALTQPLLVSGSITANIQFSSDCEDTSVAFKVSELLPDGTAYNIRTGITTLAFRDDPLGNRQNYKPGTVVELKIETLPILWQFREGSRIRVDITSSDFPQYSIHSNYPGVWSKQNRTKPAHQTIHFGKTNIEIPHKVRD